MVVYSNEFLDDSLYNLKIHYVLIVDFERKVLAIQIELSLDQFHSNKQIYIDIRLTLGHNYHHYPMNKENVNVNQNNFFPTTMFVQNVYEGWLLSDI